MYLFFCLFLKTKGGYLDFPSMGTEINDLRDAKRKMQAEEKRRQILNRRREKEEQKRKEEEEAIRRERMEKELHEEQMRKQKELEYIEEIKFDFYREILRLHASDMFLFEIDKIKANRWAS